MDYHSLDDASLLRLIAHHRSDALGELYDRYGRLVYSVAFNAISDQGAAEEITQDVFTRVWEKAHTYDADRAKVSTWLISITRNRTIDEIRRRGVRSEHSSLGWEEVPLQNQPSVDSPEQGVEQMMIVRVVREAISTLPEEQKRVLAMAYFMGYTHTEIAEALGEPLGTVKTRIRSGMQKLRELLSETIPGGR